MCGTLVVHLIRRTRHLAYHPETEECFGGDQDLNLGLNAVFYFVVDHLLHGIHILTKKQTGKDGLLHLQPVLKRTPKQALHFMTFSFFSQGVGVCPLPERDGQDGSGHPRHVPGKGHPGSLPQRGVSLH